MSRFFQRFVFVLSIAIFATLGMGFVVSEFGWFGVHAEGQEDGAYKQMHVYAEVLKKVQSFYVTEPNIDNVSKGALKGLLESLDNDSSYLTPAEYKIYKNRPTTGVVQVGVTVAKRLGYAFIVNVVPGSPAAKEHLADNDIIESIDGQSTRELSPAIIRMLLEGKPGSTVTLSVVRSTKSDPDKITLTRAAVVQPALETQMLESGSILYLKAGALTASRVDEISNRVRLDGGAHKIVLDLRDSTGEDLEQGLRLANVFVNQGVLGTLEGQKVQKQTFNADANKFVSNAPLEVLINRGTFGAAELAAAAIGDNKRADLVGERSFGEGAQIKTFELPDGAALLLTVAKYQTPKGKKIEDEAVPATVTVGATKDDGEEAAADAPPSKKDDILNKAIELLKAKAA